MTNVDQFESVFRAASKPVYTRHDLALDKALVVTDLPPEEAASFAQRLDGFLGDAGDAIGLRVLARDDFQGTGELLRRVEAEKPKLVCTYRNLHSADFDRCHSLGEHLDVLTQVAPMPVLVVPNPRI